MTGPPPASDLDRKLAALIRQYGHSAVLASAKRQAVKPGRPALDSADLNQIARDDAKLFAAGSPLIPAKTIARRWSGDALTESEKEAKITRLAKKLSPSRSYRRRAMLIAFIESQWTTCSPDQRENVFQLISSLPDSRHITQQRQTAIVEARALMKAPEERSLLVRLATGSSMQKAGARLTLVLKYGDET